MDTEPPFGEKIEEGGCHTRGLARASSHSTLHGPHLGRGTDPGPKVWLPLSSLLSSGPNTKPAEGPIPTAGMRDGLGATWIPQAEATFWRCSEAGRASTRHGCARALDRFSSKSPSWVPPTHIQLFFSLSSKMTLRLPHLH